MSVLWQDVRYGLRVLAKHPGYTVVVVLTLALAIGANTVIFSFANVLVIKPLPIRDPDGLAWVYSVDPQRGTMRHTSSYPDYLAWRDSLQSVDALAATLTRGTATLTGRGEPQRIAASRATANLFEIWGIGAVAGRLFTGAEDRPGAPCAAVLSHRYWTREFRQAASALGTSLTLDGGSCTVVGVMTPAIEFGNLSLIDVWLPLAVDSSRARRDERIYSVVGRMKPGVTHEQVGAQLRAISERLQREFPATNAGWTSSAATTKEVLAGQNTWLMLSLLVAVVTFVLLIACANVANLMLARTTGRRRELAVRTALGASRARVVRQLVTESLLLGVAGGAAGLALGAAGLGIVRAAAYEPFFELVVVDRNVTLFALALSFAAPLLFSLLPALHTTESDPLNALKEGSRSAGGIAARRSRHTLVVAQVALALMLLVVGGLIVRTMIAINRHDLGIDPEALLTLQLDLPEWKYDEPQAGRFYERLLAALDAVPGMDAAGAVSRLPVLSAGPAVRFAIEGKPDSRPEARPWAGRLVATADYFRAAGIPVLRGRAFEATDDDGREAVAIVSAQAARRYWTAPDAAIGARVSLAAPGAPPAWRRIVGVVADVSNPEIELEPDPHIYLPHAQEPARASAIVLRSDRPETLAAEVRAIVRAADSELPIYQMRTMSEALDDEQSSTRILTSLFAAFAIVALLLASAGLYGVISYSVGQRTQEIGIRMALGAVPGEIGRLVLRQALGLLAIGSAIGLLGAAGLAHTLSGVLFGVTPLDPATYAGVLLLVLASALVATWVPSRRAMRLDPVSSLRTE